MHRFIFFRLITQACEDFAATIIIGEMGYKKYRE
jgi:hypothetical protein